MRFILWLSLGLTYTVDRCAATALNVKGIVDTSSGGQSGPDASQPNIGGGASANSSAQKGTNDLAPDAARLAGTGLDDHPEINESFINGFIDGGVAMVPHNDEGSIYSMQSALRMKVEECVEASIVNARLIRGSGRMTAGEVKVGDKEQELVYLYLGMESEFLYIPGGDYDDIVRIIDEKYFNMDPVAPIILDRHLIPKLPNIEVQFSKSKVIWSIKPENYTWCKSKDPMVPASKCLLLVKKSKMDGHWNLGRPFLDGILTVASVGSTDPYVQLCYPRFGSNMSHYRTTDRVVGMPWTINDTLIVAGLVLLVLAILLYFYGDKMNCCRKRRRTANRTTASATGSASEGVTQPLIANPA